MLLRGQLLPLRAFAAPAWLHSPAPSHIAPFTSVCPCRPLFQAAHRGLGSSPPPDAKRAAPSPATAAPTQPQVAEFVRKTLFVPPGVEVDEVTEGMVLPGSNIVVGPYGGHAQIKQVEFVKSSARARDCPRDERPEFAVLGRSNVGKSSLINSLVRKKEIALTSKKPGKTQVINHFLVNKSWYIVDLPGYGFAKAPDSVRMDWFSFMKDYFLNRKNLVAALLLIDASIPPQQVDLDCANWLGRNDMAMTFVFTKCDKRKGKKGNQPDENLKSFLELIRKYYQAPPPWIMTSSVTGLGRDELLLHMSQLRNYWENY